MYLIGTKDQFNSFEVSTSPPLKTARYVVDEAGFVLYDADSFIIPRLGSLLVLMGSSSPCSRTRVEE